MLYDVAAREVSHHWILRGMRGLVHALGRLDWVDDEAFVAECHLPDGGSEDAACRVVV